MARRTFGATWWGGAWLDALEQRALVDPNRLPRGRTYARQGRVTELELAPGLLRAHVWGTDRYTSQLSVRTLTDDEWDRVIDVVMRHASNAAALLSGEVPKAIGDLVLPGEGDLGPDCSCPDSAEPCKHAAALCYVAADLFDDDPFALLTLRGRGRDEVLDEVRRRRSAALGGHVVETSNLPRGVDPGVSAAAAYKSDVAAVASARAVPRQPVDSGGYRLAVAAPADSGVDDLALKALVADAADRAWRMLAAGESSGLGASAGDDVVRRAARSTRSELIAIAEATGLDVGELELAARAWTVGGRPGRRASRSRWEPPAHLIASGVEVLGPDAKVRANRVSIGSTQLRVDEDNRWWRFEADDELGWVLTQGPATEPGELVD